MIVPNRALLVYFQEGFVSLHSHWTGPGFLHSHCPSPGFLHSHWTGPRHLDSYQSLTFCKTLRISGPKCIILQSDDQYCIIQFGSTSKQVKQLNITIFK